MPVLQGVSGITAMVLREGLPIKEFDHPWELQSPMTPTKIVKAIPGNLRPESVLIIVSNEYDFSEGLPHYLSFAVYIDGLCIKRCVCKPSDVVAGKWEQVLTYGWYNIGSRNFRVLDEEFDLGPSDRRCKLLGVGCIILRMNTANEIGEQSHERRDLRSL